jgi:hypothetical protein
MRTYAKKTIELAPRFVEAYALLARVELNAGENLDEAAATLTKAMAIAPGREDIQLLLVQTHLRANRTADARNLLFAIERSTSDPEVRRRATALLDQTEQTFTFTEITPAIEKEIEKEQPPAPLPAPERRAQETVLEALTPVGPTVEGEKLTGLLTNMDCSSGLTLTVRMERGAVEFHSSDPDKIQFLSYTADISDGNVKCGPRNPAIPVTITYKPVPGGPGNPLVVEFLEK